MTIPTRKKKPLRGSRLQNLQGPDKTIASAKAQEKRLQALELRKRKMTYAAIAKALGFSNAKMAHRYVQEALAAIPYEVAKEVKQIEIEDCRADLLRINERLATSKLSVADEMKALGAKVKLREQLARYMGLYAPVRTEVTGKDGAPISIVESDVSEMTDEQLESALDSIRKRRGDRTRGGASAEASGAASGAH